MLSISTIQYFHISTTDICQNISDWTWKQPPQFFHQDSNTEPFFLKNIFSVSFQALLPTLHVNTSDIHMHPGAKIAGSANDRPVSVLLFCDRKREYQTPLYTIFRTSLKQLINYLCNRFSFPRSDERTIQWYLHPASIFLCYTAIATKRTSALIRADDDNGNFIFRYSLSCVTAFLFR